MQKITIYEQGDFVSLDLTQAELEDFKKYLDEIWNSPRSFFLRAFAPPDRRAKNGEAFFYFRGKEVRAKNYVGLVQFKGLEICILPKFFSKDASFDRKKIYQHLEYYLHYAYQLNLPFSRISIQPESSLGHQEWGIYLALQHALTYLKTRKVYAYIEKKQDEAFIKGKFLISEYINQKFGKGKFQEFPHLQPLFEQDNPFNRLIKYTAWDISQKDFAPSITQKAQELNFLLESISLEKSSPAEMEALYQQHSQAEEKLLISFCQLYWEGLRGFPEQSPKPHFSFLIPMEQVFEKFLGAFIQEHFPKIKMEEQLPVNLGRIKDKPSPAFRLRQDLYLPQAQIVIEIKYKLRNQGNQSGVDNPDFYQILTYGLAQNARELILLYPAPSHQTEPNSQEILVDSQLLKHQSIIVKVFELKMHVQESQDMKNALDVFLCKQLEKILAAKY